jgi:hemerythrin-like domain-containing protein
VRDQAEWAGSLRPLLVRDHLRLEALLTRLLDSFSEGSPVGTRAVLWARFEMSLSAHINAEERYLLPFFARVNSEEAAELLTEHAVFRKALNDLGEGVDSHETSLSVAPEFARALRAHAQRENQLFYRWNECRVRSRGRIRWQASWA